MSVLKRLTIENYQSHLKTIIEPAPAGHLTVIVGPSDTGKTVIFRATRWLSCNEPDGTDFIRAGASFARVTEELESGHTVIRHRTAGGVNRYIIVPPGGEGNEGNGEGSPQEQRQTFEGFGRNVPLEVQEIIGIRPVTIGDTSLNLNMAEQLQGPFLGNSVSAPARAKVLGKLAGTEEIDFAGKTLGTDLYRRNQDEKRLAGEIKGLDEKIAGYDYLPGMAARIDDLERLAARIKADEERREKVAGLKEQLGAVEGRIQECRGIIGRWHCLEFVEQEAARAEAACGRRQRAWLLRIRFEDLDYSIYEAGEIIARWQGVEQADAIIKGAELTLERRTQVSRLYGSLCRAEISITGAQGVIGKLQEIDEAGNIVKGVTVLAQRRQIVGPLLGRYKDIAGSIDVTQTILARLTGVDEATKLAANIPAIKERKSTLYDFKIKIIGATALIKENREHTVLWENRVAELQGAYQDALMSAGVCPVCGQPVKKECLKEAV